MYKNIFPTFCLISYFLFPQVPTLVRGVTGGGAAGGSVTLTEESLAEMSPFCLFPFSDRVSKARLALQAPLVLWALR